MGARKTLFATAWMLSNLCALRVGWGADVVAFFSSPPRAGVVGVWCVFGLLTAMRTGDAESDDAGSHGEWVPHRLKIAVFGAAWAAFLVMLARADATGQWAIPETFGWLRYVGLLAFAVGGGVRFRAIQTREAARAECVLATSGPYTSIRHPEYLGILLLLFGLALVFRSMQGVAIGCLWTGVVWVRIRNEEAALMAITPKDYADYRARTARLLPGVY